VPRVILPDTPFSSTMKRIVLLIPLTIGCSSGDRTAADTTATSPEVTSAAQTITVDGLMQHIRTLSSDEFEGRAPGTPGEEKTVAYLTEQFKAIGLAPGNPDGSYVQNVSLIGYTAHPTASFSVNGKAMPLKYPDDYVAVSRRNAADVKVDDSELVFVGYGVVAPEYNWDDYKGVDVKGKTIVMLVNDPAVALPNDTTQLDSTVFRGRAMTYYGRWTYKYEIATEKGAAAAILVHETEPAGYPFDVVQGSWGGENFDMKPPSGENPRVAVESWLSLEKTKALFAASGKNFDSLHAAARTRAFTPVSLGARATFHVKNDVRTIESKNVVAKLEGADANLKNEYVVFTAHWDHLGRDTTLKGDQIFNGAADNASGTAGMLQIAAAFKKLPTPPARTVVFVAVTAEEQGLLGAKYYANNPLYPLDKTLANINIDGLTQWGKTKDLTVIGLGNSTLDDVLHGVLSQSGRAVRADPEPQKGFFYRSDHFEFAKQGVPALYTEPGIEFIGKPEGYGMQKREEYSNNDYHKPSDQIKPDWDLTGAVEDAQTLFRVGWLVAQTDRYPEWKPGTEFRAKREQMLKGDR
jgi:Zn-dependent M28 family amino/carboxypeptidase